MSTHTSTPSVPVLDINPLDVTPTAIAREFYVPLSQAEEMYADTFTYGATWEREVMVCGRDGAYVITLDSNGLRITAL